MRDGQNHQNAVKDTGKIAGSALSIWGEYSGSLSGKFFYDYTADRLTAVIRKTQADSRN